MKKIINFDIIDKKGNQVTRGKEAIVFWKKNITKIKKYKKESFFLHDGPPFVNSYLHAGHLINKTIKSLVLFSKNMLGYKVSTKLGFDCHGLPIINNVLKEIPENKKNNLNSLLKSCKDYANKWIKIQKSQISDMFLFEEKEYYETQKNISNIYENFSQLLMKNLLEVKLKPIFWSIADQTTLAESEIEYKNKESKSIYLPFPVKDQDFSLLIWTTTPWTIIDNQAIGYNKNLKYILVTIDKKKYLVAKDAKIPFKIQKTEDIEDVSKLIYLHPLTNKYNNVFHGDFVTNEGTGLVHLAPAHGIDDYLLCQQHNIPPIDNIDNNGFITKSLLKGLHIFKDEDKIIEILNPLRSKHGIYEKIQHSYPFSARNKTCPVIFKSSQQVFINIESIQQDVDKIIKQFNIYPKNNQFFNILQTRKEWCVSRQRLLGVPLALFVHKKTNQLLINENLQNKIQQQMKKNYKFFLKKTAIKILEGIVNPDEYQFIVGTIDVWFDSGSSFSYVKEIADLYCEGVDQFRGWFQSSLLISYLLKQQVPYKNLLAHGFVLGNDNEKMSKSVGNVLLWEDMVNMGLESIRLLVVKSNIHANIKISEELIQQSGLYYRKIRDILRFLAAVTYHKPIIKSPKLEPLEKAFISKLKKNAIKIKKELEVFNFNKAFEILLQFNQEVSEVYINARKDSVYESNQSIDYTINILTKGLLIITATFLPVASEDIYQIVKDKIGKLPSLLCYDFSFFDTLKEYKTEELMVEQTINKIKEIGGERENFRKLNNLSLSKVGIKITKEFDASLFQVISKSNKIEISDNFSFFVVQ